ncbi:MAG TPA: hypothetical protein HA301_03220 [Methanothermobacter thermautotrophicus]|uniref:Uncharacterized protein n=1 Tax=Methanothermobacter thermautotrophicus TaxID=145262 RepID=A0A7J4MYC2_METTF|nr:hypothetical protein [Methanothermobacter thermautotrophicus]HIH71053.1 hypothetical protein [Methanothermobacter thermautotrophicus]
MSSYILYQNINLPFGFNHREKGDALPRIIRLFLFLVMFLAFFEVGLISSYTLVTSKPPDIEKLLDMQIDTVSSFLDSGKNITSTITGGPEEVRIINNADVADALKARTGLDGINIKSLNATTTQDTSLEMIDINITATGYRENQTGKGQIVIRPTEQFSVIAAARAQTRSSGVWVDVKTLRILSVTRIY